MITPPAIEKFDTTVVIPVYFNEQTIGKVVESVLNEWTQGGRDRGALEFVLVDDGSKDNSWLALRELRERFNGQVTAMRLVQNHGSQLAVLAGASVARGHRIAMVAADGQEPSDLVVRMARAADEGARLVLAVRKQRADSLGTRAGAGFFYRLVRALGLKSMPEGGFDAFLMDRELMAVMLEMRDPNIPLAVTIAWLGYPYAEVSYDRLIRGEGRSRWTLRKKVKLALDAITAVSYTPIRAISLFGVTLAILGFLTALFVITEYLTTGYTVRGWASLLVAVLLIGGTQLISVGVLGEYMWRTLEVARRRPLWRVAEVHDSRAMPGPSQPTDTNQPESVSDEKHHMGSW